MTHVTRIKICGNTNIDDALFAVEAGADALGFIGVPGTPRYVEPDTYRAIIAALPVFVIPVVVVRTVADALAYNPRYIQYYEGDGADLPPGVHGIRAISPATMAEATAALDGAHHASAILVDAYDPQRLGGTGKRAEWSMVRVLRDYVDKPLVLAGGLTPVNVGDAIDEVGPYAVDVSSGVESSPGRKDHDKVAAFIRAVREADAVMGR